MEDRHVNVPFLVTAIVLVAAIVAFIIFYINTQDNFRRVRNDISALRTEMTNQITTSSASLQNTQNDIRNQLQTQLGNFSTRVTTVEANQTVAGANLKSLQDQATAALNTANAQISTLQSNVSKLTSDISAISGTSGQISSLQQKLDSLTTQVNGFTTQLSGFTAQLNSFQTNEASQTNKIATIETTLTSLNNQLAGINTSINTINNQITNLQTQAYTSARFSNAAFTAAAGASTLLDTFTPTVAGYFLVSGTTSSPSAYILLQALNPTTLAEVGNAPYTFGTSNSINIPISTVGYTYRLYLVNPTTAGINAVLSSTFYRTQ